MKSKEEIVTNWLPRYTDTPLEDFGEYILLVNFEDYLHMFSDWYKVPIRGHEKPMPTPKASHSSTLGWVAPTLQPSWIC
jgi:AMP nucleosidase